MAYITGVSAGANHTTHQQRFHFASGTRRREPESTKQHANVKLYPTPPRGNAIPHQCREVLGLFLKQRLVNECTP